jgi:ABC-type multidrug transport system ATPase subunit
MNILVEHISKSFNTIRALEDVSFEVGEGELFGLIGPDGGGKTTLFRILTTLMLPDSGNATVAGIPLSDYRAIRRSVGYMPGRFSLYQDLSVEENLKFFASIFGTTVEANYHIIKDIYVQLEPFRTRRAGALSGGMKQKLALCCALVHRPTVLFLDEPTTGVDPVARKEFWEMLKRLKQTGIPILVSTPYMDEASLCDRVALIQQGKILQTDTTAAITRSFRKKLFALKTTRVYELINDLQRYEHAHSVYPFGENIHYTDTRSEPEPEDLRSFLFHKGYRDIEIKRIDPTIEDSFMELATEKFLTEMQ